MTASPPAPRPSATVAPVALDLEREASEFLERTRARRADGLRPLRQPLDSLRGLRALHALPVVTATSAGSPEAGAVRCGLDRRPRVRRWLIGGVTAVLPLPAAAPDYLLGSDKQTLRRKIRAAERLGVTWRAIDDDDERRRLLELLDASERSHSRPDYRSARPRNDDLLHVRLWLAAFDAEERPVLLSVTPIDGAWAVLRTFRVLRETEAASAARYLMSWVLVQHLVAEGVRHLADTQSPASLSPGLRFFQRLLGYRLLRVRLAPRRRG